MRRTAVAVTIGLLAGFAVLGLVLPDWIVFLLTLALAKGLVVLSVVLLMQAGLVSFGQGLLFAAGAYGVGFAMKLWGLQEALLVTAMGLVVTFLIAALVGLLLARYREIFFAMLTLAFSMLLYGVLVKAISITGGSDGMGIAPPTFFGFAFAREQLRYVLYLYTLFCAAVMIFLVYRYLDSPLGYAVRAVRDNEIRVEYLGISVPRTVYLTYLLAGGLAGLGGVLVALSVGHIDPTMTYWTTSGEFVFVALLGGTANVFAPFVGSVVFELLRTYAFKYSPYTWQMILGAVMLGIILFMPGGLWTLYDSVARRFSR